MYVILWYECSLLLPAIYIVDRIVSCFHCAIKHDAREKIYFEAKIK